MVRLFIVRWGYLGVYYLMYVGDFVPEAILGCSERWPCRKRIDHVANFRRGGADCRRTPVW